MEEWFSLADTAIKIGLGAAISGVVTYKITKLQHTNQIETNDQQNSLAIKKEVVNRKIDLIQDLVDDFSECYEVADLLYARINGEYLNIQEKYRPTPSKISSIPVEPDTLRSLEDQIGDDTYVKFVSTATAVETKLRIIPLDKALPPLFNLKLSLNKFRDLILRQQLMPTEDKILEYRRNIVISKDEFHREIAIYLNSLHK